MRLQWIGLVSVFLIFPLSRFDCTLVDAEEIQKKDKISLAHTLTKEEVVQAKEFIEATFANVFPLVIEKDDVRVGNYLPIVFVRLDDLKKYKGKPESLINKSTSFIFRIPIEGNTGKIDSIHQPFTVLAPALGEKDHHSKLRIVQYGPSPAFQMLFDAREILDTKEYALMDSPCVCFAVVFPAGNLWFLGDVTSGQFKIKVLDRSKEGLGLMKDEFRHADEVFAALSKEAQKNIYELPPFLLDNSEGKQKQQSSGQKAQP